VANRSDLADRLVIVRLEVIPNGERRPEAELRAAFEAARPRLLGALLDAVSHGLMQLPHTRLNRLPRMADYALWVRACETAIWQAGMHMAAYEENRADAVEVVLEADPIAMALRRHMAHRPECTITATELLSEALFARQRPCPAQPPMAGSPAWALRATHQVRTRFAPDRHHDHTQETGSYGRTTDPDR